MLEQSCVNFLQNVWNVAINHIYMEVGVESKHDTSYKIHIYINIYIYI